MNFFRSILADDPDPPESGNSYKSAVDSTPLVSGDDSLNSTDNAWSFGGLLKNLAARSESVIETYRKDLEEFGSGLKKETEIIRVVASRAVKDLPVSLEAGASAAHGVLDGVLKSTAEIISREMGSDGESETPGTNSGMNSGRYSRFEVQLSALQNDLNTFCEDPDDMEEFQNWRLKFQLEEKIDEIDYLIAESGILDGIFKRVVPSMVDHETFWCRYFYRVDKLKQQERIRANLVQRAISGDDDDDELSWDVDDEEEDGHGIKQENVVKMKTNSGDGHTRVVDEISNVTEKQNTSNAKLDEVKEETVVKKETSVGGVDTGVIHESSTLHDERNQDDHDKNDTMVSSEIAPTGDFVSRNKNANNESPSNVLQGKKEDESQIKSGGAEDSANIGGEKTVLKMKSEEVPKKVNIEAVNVKDVVKDDPSQEAEEETDDLSWDEIEDVASDEEKKHSASKHGIPAGKAVLRKPLNSNEDDEDMSWDIEDDDDDQSVKS